MKLIPIDYDPFEGNQATGPVLTPVDFDPFAVESSPAPVPTDLMAGDSIDLGTNSVPVQPPVVDDVPALDTGIPQPEPTPFPRIAGPDINDLIDPGRRTREFEQFLTDREIPHGDIPETMRSAAAPSPFRNIMNSVFGDPDAVDPEAQAKSLIEFEARQQNIPAKELVANVGPEIGIAERLGKDVGSGAVGTGSGLLGYASRLTGNTGLRAGQIKADEIADELMAVNPQFVDKLMAGFGSTGTLFVPGLGIAKGAQALAAVSPRMALWLGSSASAGMEAAVEAGDVYNQLLGKGFSEADAAERADKAFWANAALVGVTNRLGLFSDAGNALQRRTMGALFEGVGQELPQQVISNLATDRPAFEGGGEAAAIGSIVGGTFAGNTGGRNEQASPAERMPPRNAAQPELNTEVFQQPAGQNDFAQRPRAVSDTAQIKLVPVEGNPFAENTQSEEKQGEQARVEQPAVQAAASKEAAALDQADEFALSAPEGVVPEVSNVSNSVSVAEPEGGSKIAIQKGQSYEYQITEGGRNATASVKYLGTAVDAYGVPADRGNDTTHIVEVKIDGDVSRHISKKLDFNPALMSVKDVGIELESWIEDDLSRMSEEQAKRDNISDEDKQKSVDALHADFAKLSGNAVAKEETDVIDTTDPEEEEAALENERDYIEKQLPQFYTHREIATFQRQTAQLGAQETVDFYAKRYDEGQKRGSRKTASASAATSASVPVQRVAGSDVVADERIDDLGEKIGGARKDTAIATGKRAARVKDERPAWKKRYAVVENLIDNGGASSGKFNIFDTRTKKALRGANYRALDFSSIEEAEKALPLAAVGEKHRVYTDGDNGFTIWRDTGKHKRVRVIAESFATREEAMKFMAQNAEQLLATKLNFGEEVLPRPEKVYRDGDEHRSGDVNGESFMEKFGFRGVEFGKWNNQQERQEVMNHAYDALLDMADVIGVEPMALSLNGELALAFGARGQGLSGAVAHYEPSHAVINLTKMNGAGSLAHEWFHSLDHYFARQDGQVSSEKETNARGDKVYPKPKSGRGYVSKGFLYNSKVRPELQEAYKSLIKTMHRKATTYVDDTKTAERFVGKARDELRRNLDNIRGDISRQLDPKYWKRNNKPASAEQLARFDELADALVNGESLDTEIRVNDGSRSSITRSRMSNDVIDELAGILKKVRGRSGFKADHSGPFDRVETNVRNYRQRIELLKGAETSTKKTRNVPTDYHMQAKAADQARSGDYWSSPHEMAARAFEAYIEDKIAAKESRNDFLIYHAHGAVFVPVYPEGLFRPYPEGKEREAVNGAFDDLFNTIKSKKTDKGVALFSRRRQGDGDIFEFAAQAWEALATGNDKAFQQPKSLAKGMREIARDINMDLSVEVLDVAGKPGLRHEWVINTGGKKAFIRENVDGTLEMNVASLVSGKSRGSEIYNLAATYAHNNGKVFIGDREGLSDEAVYRRTENMLSSALKFGTTRHLRPHPRQKLDWTENPQTNLENLIKKHYTNITEQVPLLEDIVYDFNLQHFVTKGTDQEVTARQFRQLSNTAGGKAARAGPATLKRAAVTNALVQEKDSGRRRGILASLSRQRHSERRIDKPLKDILYSKKPGQSAGLSVADVEQAIAPTILNWSDAAPRVEVVQALEDIPEHIVDADVHEGGAIEAVYDQVDGTVYMVAGQIESVERAQVVLAHEAVGHYGMEELLGKEFQPVLERVQWLKKSGDKRVRELADEVRKHHGELDKDTESREIIAVMAEQGIKHPILTRIVSALKDFLRKLGFKIQFTAADLEAMVARAARFVEAGKANEKKAGKIASRTMFSRKPEDMLNDVDEAASEATTGAEWVEVLKSKTLDDTRSTWLAGLTRRHIADIGSDVFPQLDTYVNLAQKMDAERNELVNEAADIADRWTKFASRDSVAADEMAALMHDSTVAGVDPSEAYTPLIEKKEAQNRIRMLNLQASGSSGQAYIYINKVKEVKQMLGFEKSRAPKYAGLKARHDAMSDEAKALFKDVRDMYSERHSKMMAALLERIDRAEVSAQEKRKLKEQIRIQFENQKVQAPYFPLARFGDFWVSAKKGDDAEFYMYESSHQQKKDVRKLREEGYDVSSGKRIENVKALHGASESFVTEIVQVVNKLGNNGKMSAEIADAVYQLYLSTLPDLSVRKNFIHRKKTTGFSADALRAFASQSFHGSYQLAKLRYSDQLQGALENMREHIPYSKESNKASDIYNEMQKRHEWAMNPTSAAWANTVTSVAFVWYLGITPSAALVNTSQTALVALPVLAGKHGLTKSGAELLKASKDYFAGGAGPKKGMFSMEHVLKGDELAAFKALEDEGVIDKTRAHDLIGVSETPSKIYSPTKDKAMRIVSFLFHHAERYNREVTGLAAYRLARKSGMSHRASIDYARDVVYVSHFDYSNANKARFMQNDAAKVLLIFRQYSLNMTYLLARSAHQSLKGESAEVRSEARKKLAGVLAQHAVVAGAYGLPLFWVVEAIMNAVFDDEDEPWDFRTEARNFLADYFGEDAADVITTGPANKITGVDIHSRVSLNELWFRSPSRDLEGKAYVQYWFEQVAGPGGSILTGIGRGYDLMREGNIWRGIEAMTPKAIRDGLKALRYADEGVTTLRGDQVVSDLSAFELWMQGIGFTPADVAKQYDANRALRNYAYRLKDRRKLLINRWWLATRTGDGDGRDEAMSSIREFNRKNPRHAITKQSLKQSAKTRRRISAESRNGISLRRRDRHLRDRVRFADD